MAVRPQNEAVRMWALVEPPNVLHRVTGETALSALARAKGIDVGNMNQVCSVTPGPRGKPLKSAGCRV